MDITRISAGCVAAGLLVAAALAAPRGDGLADAAKNRDGASLRRLLAAHADVNAAQGDGATALHWAAHWDDADAVGLLLHAGAKANAANQLGVTPLSLACTNGNAPIVAALLDAGANPSAAAANGETPLMLCARSGNAASVRRLLDHKAEVNAREHSQDQTALMWAAAERHPDVVRLLLDHGADVHAKARVTKQFVIREENGGRLVCPSPEGIKARCTEAEMVDRGGSTPLLFAARTGDGESAKILLAAGASANEKAPDGSSALVVAAYSGNTEVAKVLLDKDALPNSADAGFTALHAAVLRGDPDLVASLLKHAANANAQISKGTPILRSAQDYVLPNSLVGATPVFLAAKFVEPEIMRALQSAGADVNLPIRDGTTALMAAAGVGWKGGETRRGLAFAMVPPPDGDAAMAAVRIALAMGADVRAANAAGETALHGAATEGYPEIAQLLIDRGANINARTKRGETPLALTSAGLLSANGAYGARDRRSVRAVLARLGGVEDPPRDASPRNLKVIKDPAQIRTVMASFTEGLGVQCEFCHTQDRASDDNPHKDVARRMMLMTAEINARFAGISAQVSCYTCHRGETSPKMAPAR